MRDSNGQIWQSINILNVDRVPLVFPAYMLLYVGRLLRDQITVRAFEAGRLAALVSQVREEASFLAEYARAIGARIPRTVRYETSVKSATVSRTQ